MRALTLVPGVALLVVAAGLAGCGGGGGSSAPSSGGTTSSGRMQLHFWHTRRGEQETLLKSICSEYSQANPTIELVPEFQGSYDDLNKKVRAAIQGKSLPALTVGYESHVSEYMANDVVRPLDDLVKEPELGFKPEELADIPEQYLSQNRYAQYGNQLLSFPFTKSNLVLYYNQTLLDNAGFKAPPKTWAEFEQQAAAVSAKSGSPAFVFDNDPSTLDGLVFSYGGEVLAKDGEHTLFDQPATVKALSLLDRMTRTKSMVKVGREDVVTMFTSQKCAFVLSSTSGRSVLETTIKDQFKWDMTIPPHDESAKPVTVMYGPNVCIFKSTPEQEREAWKFVKYFVSPAVTARWAMETGYLPVRKSAVASPEMQKFYAANPRALHAYEALKVAKGEPNVVGWQEVRNHLQSAAEAVMSGRTTPQAAATDLKQKADQTLAQSKQK